VCSALDLYSASDYLPTALTDPEIGPSYAVEKTAFQLAVGTNKPRWEWLEELIPADQSHFERNGYPRNVPQAGNTGSKGANGANGNVAKTKPRPEHEIFGLAMLGGGRVFGTAHIYGLSNYPNSGSYRNS
jgi:hypothetical protein